MTLLLMDTGPLVAALDRSELHHEDCAAILSSRANSLVTCEAVIAEACHILRRANLPAAARDILNDVHRGEYQIPWHLTDRAAAVAKLMKKYADVPMSLADACLVDMATQLDTGRILTLDAHFQVYRWGRRRAFELMVELA